LAQGGMGALYIAVTGDRGLERLMVIKTVLPHLADAEYLARFRDEAKVVVKLSHGNLIPVFDAGQVDGELFLAMDFVEGRDLRAVWNRCAKKQVAFPIDVAVYIVKELCRGLAYAHNFPDLHLVHRDVSPPNVLISFTGEVKLTDFGLASSTLKLEKTAPGIIYGKVAYMSPEQARGEKLDGRSDQYAAGIVLWELLTGRQLFPPGKDQPQDLLTRAKNPDVLRPSKRAPRVPPELDEICLRSLASGRDERYGGCDDMRQALQSWMAKNAPTTDASRISTFLHDLFADDITRERAERETMISSIRRRAMTLPPTDELRQLIERSDAIIVTEPGSAAPPVRQPGSVGRRASDRGNETADRRTETADRRAPQRMPSPVGGGGAATAVATRPKTHQDVETEANPDLLGKVIDGRYRIDELIGEGGMGKVYLAEHVEIGKRVAVKVLHPSYGRLPDLVERFRREARAASKIGHPHIVDVTDSGTTEEGAVYFVMEYLEGVELGSVIEREGALEAGRALRIASQICRALAAAHAQSIVHRDLKPENIFLVTRDGAADFVKVLDFGIAKTTEAEAARERKLTSPGMAMGTPEYMAPEQAAGRPADARCDVYALGAILYEMLTGVPPYQGDNFMEILTKKATVDPVPPVVLRPGIPDTVNGLVIEAMARNPDARPQTMESFEYELTKCLAGRGAAVAQIMGMTTDPSVVAGLNPGLAQRNMDDGSGLGRAVTQTGHSQPGINMPSSVYVTPVPGTLRTPAPGLLTPVGGVSLLDSAPSRAPVGRTTGPQDAVAAPPQPAPFDMSSMGTAAMVSSTTEPVDRKAVGVVGWFLLALLILGCAGVIVFVALNERDKAREPLGASASGAVGEGTSVTPNNPITPPQPQGSNTPPLQGSAKTPIDDTPDPDPVQKERDNDDKDKDKDKDEKDRGKKDQKSGNGKKPATVDTPRGEPATDAEARSILDQAEQMRSANRLTEAYAAYGQVANGKFRKGQGYLGQALVRIAQKKFKDAADLATLAMKFGGGPRATITRAAAVRRLGDAQLAILYYEKAIADAGGNKAIVDEARIALDKLAKDCPSCKFAKKTTTPSPAPPKSPAPAPKR
jgi:serine/threonine protein kinase